MTLGIPAATDAYWRWASQRERGSVTGGQHEAFEAGFVEGGKYALRASASVSGLCQSLQRLIELLEGQGE